MSPIRALKDRLTMRHMYRRTFSTPEGQKVLAHLCKHHVLSSAFTAASDRTTAYDNGSRDLVMGILKQIHSSDEDLQKQLAEYMNLESQPQPQD
jgi:hypothetical protein